MARDPAVPFALWVSAALVAHFLCTAGAYPLVAFMEDLADIRWFAQSVRAEAQAGSATIEVVLEDAHSSPEAMVPESRALPRAQDPHPPEEPKPQEEQKPAPTDAQKKRRVAELTVAPVVQERRSKPLEVPKTDQRIAVKQHVADKNQEDNPNARFVGDEANRVDEETVARITAHDMDDPDPTPGGQHAGPSPEPGNATETRIGQSDDHPGTPGVAPGESATDEPVAQREEPKSPEQPPPAQGAAEPQRASAAPERRSDGAHATPDRQRGAAATPEPQSVSPEVVARGANAGEFSIDPRRKRVASSAQSAQPKLLGPADLRLGAGPNERGIRTSMRMEEVVEAVGADQLRRERSADGERRRSAHRGSWNSSHPQRWRGAIENYVSSVKPGNQTALNTARVPFATYLVTIHNRLHPIFADGFLSSLDSLAFDHPMNDYKLMTRLEVVVDPAQGRIVKMGVVDTSGIGAFDVGALDSMWRAQPFGKAPQAIISLDGNVYLHWEFHRNPIYACSTMGARPFLLNTPPPAQPSEPPPREPRPPPDPRERGLPPGPGTPSGTPSNRYGRAPHGRCSQRFA